MNLLLLTPLIFFPLFSDLFSLPKLLWLSLTTLFLVLSLVIRQGSQTLNFPLWHPLAIFILADLLSVKNAVNLWEWFFSVSNDLMGIVVFYYAVNLEKRKEWMIERTALLMKIFIVVTSISSLSALSAYYLGWPFSIAAFHAGRGGTMGNPNFSALLTAMAIPIVLIPPGWTTLPFVVILSWHLGITASRGAFIALGAVLCLWGLLLKEFEKIAFLVLGMFAVTILLLFVQGNLSLQTLDHRLTWWKGSVLMAKDYPLGVGRGNWSLVYPMYAGMVGDKTMDTQEIRIGSGFPSKLFVNQAHNDYLQILAEIGPIGLLALLWLIYRIAEGFLRERSADGQGTQEVKLGIFLAWLVLLIGGVFSFPLQMPELSVFFWLFSGILALHGSAPKPVEDQVVIPTLLDPSAGY